MSAQRWFSYDPANGFDLHDTEQAAKDAAEASLDWYRDAARDYGWEEEVGGVCWGRVQGVALKVTVDVHDPDCPQDETCYESGCYDTHGVSPEHDETCDYQLVPFGGGK